MGVVSLKGEPLKCSKTELIVSLKNLTKWVGWVKHCCVEKVKKKHQNVAVE